MINNPQTLRTIKETESRYSHATNTRHVRFAVSQHRSLIDKNFSIYQGKFFPYGLHTLQFAHPIRYVNSRSQRIISHDVTSLFTNVPLAEPMNFICENVSRKGIHIGIPIEYHKELLELCTTNVQFPFDGNIPTAISIGYQ